MNHRVDIEPTSVRGERGQHYRVLYAGEVLIEGTWNPEFEACRALLAMGVRGNLQTWRRGKQHWDLQVDIERGAGLTVEESENHGPKIVRWRPRPQDVVLAPGGRTRRLRSERQWPNCGRPGLGVGDNSRGNLADPAHPAGDLPSCIDSANPLTLLLIYFLLRL